MITIDNRAAQIEAQQIVASFQQHKHSRAKVYPTCDNLIQGTTTHEIAVSIVETFKSKYNL